MKTFKDLLIKLDACEPAIEWAKDMPIEEIVKTCHRGDWLLWLAYRVDVDERKIILCAGLSAATVKDKMKDRRSIEGVEAAIAYGEGKITKKELIAGAVDADASAAYDAAYAAYDAAKASLAAAMAALASLAAAMAALAALAALASLAAAMAALAALAALASLAAAMAALASLAAAADASAAYDAAYAAATAADASAAARAASAAAMAADNKEENQLLTANICREHIGPDIIQKVKRLLAA